MTRWLLPLMASAISLVFAYLLWRQFATRRKVYQALWAISFILFAVATFAEFYSELAGTWPVGIYRFYYWSAAALVGFMGAGSFYLLPNKRLAHVFLAFIVVVAAIMMVQVMSAEVNTEAFVAGRTVAGKAMPRSVRIFSPLLTVPGGLSLIGIAVISWLRTRAAFNLLIALGGVVISAAGGAARFGSPEYLYLGEILGLVIIFFGFLKSREMTDKGPVQPSRK